MIDWLILLSYKICYIDLKVVLLSLSMLRELLLLHSTQQFNNFQNNASFILSQKIVIMYSL